MTTLPVPVFSSWRPLWDATSETHELAEAADCLALRRNQIWDGSGEVTNLGQIAPRLQEFRALRQDKAASLRHSDPAMLQRSYVEGIIEFSPVIEASCWSRWLLLEQALSDAMLYGDLLFAALVLRTQIDDLDSLLRLQEVQRQSAGWAAEPPASPVTQPALDEMEKTVDFLWQRYLPRLGEATLDEVDARKQEELPAHVPDELWNSFAALNDYVHPNYGSHIAALFPERSASGKILLTAFNAVYESFLGLDFVKRRPVIQTRSTSAAPVPHLSILRRFVQRVLPKLDRRLKKSHGYHDNWAIEPLSVFTDRLKREMDDHRTAARFVLDVGDDLEAKRDLERIASSLRPLCSAVEPGRQLPTEDVVRFVDTHATPTFVLNMAMWLQLAKLRGLAEEIEAHAQQLPVDVLFPRQPPFDRWVALASDAVTVATLVSSHKTELMRAAAIRMVNQSNPLGAVLCMRSVLEHCAVATDLARRFSSGLESIEEAARSGRDVISLFEQLERDVGRFLIGTKATSDPEMRWKERWARSDVPKHVNVAQAVERSFEQQGRHRALYDYASECAHGNRLTGGELLWPDSDSVVARNLAFPVIVLAESERSEWTLDFTSPVMAAYERLTRQGGIADAKDLDELRVALRKGTSFGQPLKRGRDVLGQGTREDPFRFRDELQYHLAFYQFCDEQGIDLEQWQRCIWNFGEYVGDCVTSPDGAELYFRAGRWDPDTK
jgi:hypothetical protein